MTAHCPARGRIHGCRLGWTHMQTTVENTDKHTVKLTIEVPVD